MGEWPICDSEGGGCPRSSVTRSTGGPPHSEGADRAWDRPLRRCRTDAASAGCTTGPAPVQDRRHHPPCRSCGPSHGAQSLFASRRLFTKWFGKRHTRTPAFLQPSCWYPPPGCPFFDRPKRRRKKPHQPALAHCVHVAGLDALRLTALPRVGAANRKGPKGHPVDSLGHLRWPRSDIDSRRAPSRRITVRDAAPRKARKTRSAEEGGEPTRTR
jgi:hypothetical protein